jgi:two-component system NtrC family response regulator
MAAEKDTANTILIVEDDESIRTQMKWALQDDYEVLLAEDRVSAMEIIKGERPSVVTLDLGLPPRPAEVEEGSSALPPERVNAGILEYWNSGMME